MPAPQFDKEKIAAATMGLEACMGWREWFVPIQRHRMDEIAAQLLKEGLGHEETEKLRTEWRVIGELLEHPGKVLASLRKPGERPAGPVNGAV